MLSLDMCKAFCLLEDTNQFTICKTAVLALCTLQLHPPLPAFRVTEAPAFTYTGVDYAGPLYIKSPQGSRESKV